MDDLDHVTYTELLVSGRVPVSFRCFKKALLSLSYTGGSKVASDLSLSRYLARRIVYYMQDDLIWQYKQGGPVSEMSEMGSEGSTKRYDINEAF